MATYTGIAVHLKLRKVSDPAEQQKLNELKQFLSTGESETERDFEQLFEHYVFFSAWNWRKVKDEINHYQVEMRSSTRTPNKVWLMAFLTRWIHFFIVEDGDILVRLIYEYASQETVITYDAAGGRLVESMGYDYGDGAWMYNNNHPTNHSVVDTEFIPPLNIHTY